MPKPLLKEMCPRCRTSGEAARARADNRERIEAADRACQRRGTGREILVPAAAVYSDVFQHHAEPMGTLRTIRDILDENRFLVNKAAMTFALGRMLVVPLGRKLATHYPQG